MRQMRGFGQGQDFAVFDWMLCHAKPAMERVSRQERLPLGRLPAAFHLADIGEFVAEQGWRGEALPPDQLQDLRSLGFIEQQRGNRGGINDPQGNRGLGLRG